MSFANTGLLWGLLAVAVPIVIFLMFRRKFKRLEWAAMEFLLRAQRRTNRRLKIENLLLLLIRCLVLAFLAFALARPKLSTFGANLLPFGESRHHIIVIDNSFSMNYQFEMIKQETFLARALKEANSIVENAYEEDEISVIRMDVTPEIVVQNYAVKDDFVIGKINETEASHQTADFAAALLAVQETVESSTKENQLVYILTDFQLSTFARADEEEEEPAASEGEETAVGIEILTRDLTENPKVKVHIVDVGDDAATNHQISYLGASKLKTLATIETEFTVEVMNHSPHSEQNYEVVFYVDGEERSREVIDELPPREKRELTFHHTFLDPGFHYLSASAAEASKDLLIVDDSRYLALEVLPNIRVLAVNGEVGADFNGETDFLRAAFPTEEMADHVSIRMDVVLDPDLTKDSFEQYDVILMCNVGTLDEDVLTALDDAVRVNGKSVVWFMGDQVDVPWYNVKLYQDAKGLLPAKLIGREGDSQKINWIYLRPDTFEHPILHIFHDEAHRGFIYGAMIFEYMGLGDYKNDSQVRTIIKYDNGAAAMIDKPCGEGKSLLVTTTIDKEWNNLPITPVYLPLLSETIAYLAYRDRTDLNLSIGNKIVKEYPLDYSSEPEILTPRRGSVKIDATMNKTLSSRYIVYPNTYFAGIYTLFARRKDPSDDSSEIDSVAQDLSVYFSANVDPAEGDLERASEQLLRTVYPAFRFEYRRYNPREPVIINAKNEDNVRELWKFLAYAVLALLLIESFLAQRFGQHKKQEAQGTES